MNICKTLITVSITYITLYYLFRPFKNNNFKKIL